MSTTREMFVLAARFLVWLLIVAACSPLEQQQIQTEIAAAAQTAMAEGKVIVATEVREIGGTKISGIATQIGEGIGTSVASVGTRSADLLTPERPRIMVTPRPDDVVSYIVEKGDNLSEIAHRFGVTTEWLIEVNAGRYPSLLTHPNYVEIGWDVIVAINAPPVPTSIPTPYSTRPDCDVSSIYWLESPITCQPYSIQLVTEIGVSIGCVVLDENPLGYYKVVTTKSGWYLIDNRGVHSYTWFVDRERNETVIGPAIVTEEFSYPECGIPTNP